MKRFIAISFIAIVAVQTWACGFWMRPNYYMFSVFNRNLMDNTFSAEASKYWSEYTGDDGAQWAMSSLASVDPNEFDKSKNAIIETAIKRNDAETINYLKLLVKYLNNDGSQFNRWNYPTKEQITEMKTAVKEVKQKALLYKGKRYKNHYALLVMRCNMTAENHQANIDYWNKTASKLKDNIFKNWMKDIYAGALFNTGKKDEACNIYAELGDMTSIKYCVRKKRNLKGIKEEYAANPNSPTLIFLVQDFVNNTQETLDNGSDPEIMRNIEATGIYKNDIDGFIDFAGKVLREGKTKSPAMWEAARGFVNYLDGNQADALKQLANAQQLNGTQRMKDNARACLMLARIKDAQLNDEFFNTMLADYKWLESKAGISDNNIYADDPHYKEVLERISYEELATKLKEAGKNNMSMALIGMADSRTGYSMLWGILDDISSSEYDDFHNYLTQGQHNDFEKWLIKQNKIDNDTFNDKMGTKLVREGEFQAAINYLEKVPLEHISKHGTSYYMARKDYNQVIWFKRQFLSFMREEPTQVKSNAKLQYCRDMVALDKQIAQTSGEDLNNLLYKKANLLYQASHKGDCWYLAHYSNGVYDEALKNEYDFIGTARQLLRIAENNTSNLDLKQQCIFAQTFITGENTGYCIIEDYDWKNNTSTFSIDRNLPHYNAITRLLDFSAQHPDLEANYISKCDIIKKFRKYN